MLNAPTAGAGAGKATHRTGMCAVSILTRLRDDSWEVVQKACSRGLVGRGVTFWCVAERLVLSESPKSQFSAKSEGPEGRISVLRTLLLGKSEEGKKLNISEHKHQQVSIATSNTTNFCSVRRIAQLTMSEWRPMSLPKHGVHQQRLQMQTQLLPQERRV